MKHAFLAIALFIAFGTSMLPPAFSQSLTEEDAYIERVTKQPVTRAEVDQYNAMVKAGNEANSFARNKDYKAALALYEKAYQLWPTPIRVDHLFMCYSGMEDWEGFQHLFTRFVSKKGTPGYDDILRYRQGTWLTHQAVVASQNNRLEETQQYLQQARAIMESFQNHPLLGDDARRHLAHNQQNLNSNQRNIDSAIEHEQKQTGFINNQIAKEIAELNGQGQNRRMDYLWMKQAMPIKIAVMDGKNVEGYQPQWAALVDKALLEWSSKTNNMVSFQQVPDPAQADITVDWADTLNKTDKPFQDVGNTNAMFLGDSLLSVDITIATHTPQGEQPTDVSQYATILHEFGHALGLTHHSPNRNDIMNPLQSHDIDILSRGLSANDVAMLVNQYQSPQPHVLRTGSLSGIRENRQKLATQLELAFDQLKNKKYRTATKSFEALNKQTPDISAVHLGLMMCYLNRNKTKPIKKLMEHWTNTRPNAPITILAHAFYEDRLGIKAFHWWNWKKAIHHLSMAQVYYRRVPKTSGYYDYATSAAQTAQKNIIAARQNNSGTSWGNGW